MSSIIYISCILCFWLHSDALIQYPRTIQTKRSFNLYSDTISSQSSPSSSSSSKSGIIDLLYDSECPICNMEVNFLKKRDIENKIRFTDISSPDYNPAEHGNVKFEDGMRKLRAVLPDNTVITGIEVFRQTYKSIGLGWIFEATNLPLIGPAADMLYDLWAENRLRITGRGDLADVLKRQAQDLKEKGPADCDVDGCALEFDDLDE